MLIFRGRSRKDQIRLHHAAVAGLRRALNELETLRQASGDADGSFTEIMRAGDRLVRQWGSLELRIRNGHRPGEARKAVILQWKETQGFLEQHKRMAAALAERRQHLAQMR